MKTQIKLEWGTEKRLVKDLIAYEHNPRVMNAKQRKALEDSLAKFDLVEIPVADADNTIIAGHQRIDVLVALGRLEDTIDVRVPNRKLTELELKEYNIASNAIKGDWLDNVLAEHFTEIDFDKYGIDLSRVQEELEQKDKLTATATEKPVYPIVAKFSEKYDAFVIVCDNAVDIVHLREILGLGREQSYKCNAVGQTHVITAKSFIEKWENRQS